MTTTPQAALLSDALEKMGDFFHAHEAWQLCRIDDGRIQLHLTDDQYEAVRLAVADKLKPRSSTLTNDELIDLAVEHGLGRTLPPLGLNTGNVFYTDNSYRTAALFDFADAHESAILAKLQATQEPVQAGELPTPFGYVSDGFQDGLHFQHKPWPEMHMLLNSVAQVYSAAQMRAALSARKPLLYDLICNAIDLADTESMNGDYMLESGDCIAVVRTMQALIEINGIGLEVKP